jgi:hypothetical protein
MVAFYCHIVITFDLLFIAEAGNFAMSRFDHPEQTGHDAAITCYYYNFPA